MTLHLNLPEPATVADLISALQTCDPDKLVTNDVYEPVTAVIIDEDDDVMISILRRVTPPERTTLRVKVPPELLEMATSGK